MLERFGGGSGANPVDALPAHAVERGPLTISVTEDGSLVSDENVDIVCGVAGGATIVWMVDDGARVTEGTEIVRLDSSVLAESVTASLKAWAPEVFTEPPARTVVPAASVVTLASGVVPPIAPPKVVVPAELAVRANAPPFKSSTGPASMMPVGALSTTLPARVRPAVEETAISAAVRLSKSTSVPARSEKVPAISEVPAPRVVLPAVIVTSFTNDPAPPLSPKAGIESRVTTPVPALIVRLLVSPDVAKMPAR
ncbi:MAG: hypothetical protein EBS01_10300, partial [Verrucomicrobia bacterium]|nr:hypothetical protein [Verrucomicrobiota bacterium]